MALYPAADMRTGAISVWVAGADEAERAAEIVRGLGHVGSRSSAAADDPLRTRRLAARRARAAARQVDLPPGGDRRARWAEGETRSSNYLDAADTRSTLAAVAARRRRGRAARRPATCRIRGVGLRGRRRPRSTSATPARCCGCCPAGSPVSRRGSGRSTATSRFAGGRWTGSPSRCGLMGAEVEARDGRLPPLRVRGGRAARDRLRAPGRQRPGEVVRAAGRPARRRSDGASSSAARPAITPSGCCAPPGRGADREREHAGDRQAHLAAAHDAAGDDEEGRRREVAAGR